jgi:hypothetical protein
MPETGVLCILGVLAPADALPAEFLARSVSGRTTESTFDRLMISQRQKALWKGNRHQNSGIRMIDT